MQTGRNWSHLYVKSSRQTTAGAAQSTAVMSLSWPCVWALDIEVDESQSLKLFELRRSQRPDA